MLIDISGFIASQVKSLRLLRGSELTGAPYFTQIIGPKDSTEPQAGLDTTTRAGPMARLIVKAISDGGDPEQLLSYNSFQWSNASHHPFPVASDWLKPVSLTINGHKDYFSQRYVKSVISWGFDAHYS